MEWSKLIFLNSDDQTRRTPVETLHLVHLATGSPENSASCLLAQEHATDCCARINAPSGKFNRVNLAVG